MTFNNFKYFTLSSNMEIGDIKKQYKTLAFKFHPDITGRDTNKEMQEIIAEYEKVLKELGKVKNKNYQLDNEYINIIDALIKLKMENVTIEICGWFIYVHGNTKPYKNALGKEGLKLLWNGKKQAWYYKPSWYQKRNRKAWSMEKIRDVYGSEKVNNEYEQEYREAITA